jgi:signal transduction histidine kinase
MCRGENVRLFKELEVRNKDLTEALEQKTATAEILQVISSSPTDLQPVFDTIVRSATLLCGGIHGVVLRYDGELMHLVVQHGFPVESLEQLRRIFPRPPSRTLIGGMASTERRVIHQAVDQKLGQIRGDGRKIKQVLLNLLSNALKFTPEGGRVEVRASVTDGTAEISVADTGVGIAPEDQEAMFEEFRQVGTGDKKVEGTGLGLALSRKFIELHGGRIWVRSQLGSGSTFTFTISVRRDE